MTDTAHIEGECPRCGSENLEYGAMERQDGMVFWPVTCNDCGAELREWWSLEFDDWEVVDSPPSEDEIWEAAAAAERREL